MYNDITGCVVFKLNKMNISKSKTVKNSIKEVIL